MSPPGDAEVYERMSARLAELREELRRGELLLRELRQQEAALRESMLRISGAVQVLSELLQPGVAPGSAPAPAPSEQRPDGRTSDIGAADAPRVLSVP